MPLDLVVPDLLPPADAPAAIRCVRLPALERWLARGDVVSEAVEGPYGWIAAQYGLPEPTPFAAIALAADVGAIAGTWLRADPVHLRIDHDDLKLHDASVLGLSASEASELISALRAHFAADGLEFIAPSADRWYVRVSEGTAPRTTPLWKAFGRNVFGLLPVSEGAFNWRSAFTEAQMTLAGHAVNRRREEDGRLAVNSIWLWGEGARPATLAKRFGLVHADDAFARGLAELSSAEARSLPGKIADIDLPAAGTDALVVVDTLTAPLRRADDGAWLAAAAALDEGWFAHLGDAIARFDSVRLILPSERGTRVATLTAGARWRIFRARKPLAAHA